MQQPQGGHGLARRGEEIGPPFTADDYVAVSHPTTFRNTKNSLETIECGGLAA